MRESLGLVRPCEGIHEEHHSRHYPPLVYVDMVSL